LAEEIACGEIEAIAMPQLPQKLLSLALHVRWEVGAVGDKRAVRILTERMPGLDDESYTEALERAKAMDEAAWRLADAWHASKGSVPISLDELSSSHPGFSAEDYQEAMSNNLLWASK
jgi:hypothetical protein